MPDSTRGSGLEPADAATESPPRPSHAVAKPVGACRILHVLGDDTPASRLDAARALLGAKSAHAHEVFHVGTGTPDGIAAPRLRGELAGVIRLGPLRQSWLAALIAPNPPRTGEFESRLADAGARAVVHAWSGRALAWLDALLEKRRFGAAGKPPTMVIDADAAGLPACAVAVAHEHEHWRSGRRVFVGATQRVWQGLRGAGAAEADCVVVRSAADFGALERARAAGARRALQLEEPDRAVLVLPPISREGGAYCGAWAAMLAYHVDRRVRLVVPGCGREARRIRCFVESCGLMGMARFAGERWTQAELLAAADLVAFVPTGDVSLDGLAWAMASGKPIVASAIPAVTELLSHGRNALLARADDPKDTARRIVEALDAPDRAAELARTAHSQAYAAFGRQRMAEQLETVYRNVAAGREAHADVVDPVFQHAVR